MIPVVHNLFDGSNSLVGELSVLEHCTKARLVTVTVKWQSNRDGYLLKANSSSVRPNVSGKKK